MKKILSSVLVAMLACVGLVAIGVGTTSSATAAVAKPYPGSVPTNCRLKLKNPVAKGESGKVLALVEVPGSKKHPKGKMVVKVKRKKGGANYKFVVDPYKGELQKFFTPKLKKTGVYKVTLKFKPKAGSVFKKCKKRKPFTVS